MRRGARDGALPNLVVIGAMSAGTTSLYHYLRWHPQIQMAVPKELIFFADGWNWARGIEWYRSHFSPDAAIRGEVSPIYTTYPEHRGVPARMHQLIPDAKLIYLVRHPIERMITQYVNYVSAGKEFAAFDAALLRETDNRYLERSRYWTQLEQFLEYYDRAQILVVRSEDLAARRVDTLRRVFAFVGVNPEFSLWRFALRRHASRRKRRRTPVGELIHGSAPMRLLRRMPHRFRWPLEEALLYPFSRPIGRPVVSPGVRRVLWDQLEGEVARLGEFMHEDLSDWLDSPARDGVRARGGLGAAAPIRPARAPLERRPHR